MEEITGKLIVEQAEALQKEIDDICLTITKVYCYDIGKNLVSYPAKDSIQEAMSLTVGDARPSIQLLLKRYHELTKEYNFLMSKKYSYNGYES